MGPFLYDIFINDLKKATEHTILGIAGAVKLDWVGEAVNIFRERAAIQRPRWAGGRHSRDHEELKKDI